ncbi:MAG: Y-family DNA polymerase [Planctomycetota bacterium]
MSRPPVLLYAQSAGRQLVARCCAGAAAAGVRAGMTVAHARALLPGGTAVAEPHQPQRELAALEALARWALRFSPIVAVDPPDGLLIDIAGCRRLFGGERRHVHLIAGATERLGFCARVTAAPTFACARAVARFGSRGEGEGDGGVIAAGGQRDALAALPVEALGVEAAIVDGLREVGIDRIGHLFELPRSSLAARFGLPLLRRLDQAVGRAPETIDPVRPVAPPVVERVFAGPATQLEAVVLAVRGLLVELSNVLEHRECGARRLELQLDRPDAGPLSVAITLGRPSRDVKHLWSLLGPKLESINLGWGVERLRLAATGLGRLAHEDGAWAWSELGTDRKQLDRAFGELLDTLSNRLGPGRVVRVDPVESHLPERTFRLRPVMEKKDGHRFPPSALGDGPAGDRPSLLLEEPEPIAVIALMPDGPPSWFRWRGTERRITASAGPERIAAEWWTCSPGVARRPPRGRKTFGESYARAYERFMLGRAAPAAPPGGRPHEPSRAADDGEPAGETRDYFKVQDERGRWLWIYRVLEQGCWFVHGLWA